MSAALLSAIAFVAFESQLLPWDETGLHHKRFCQYVLASLTQLQLLTASMYCTLSLYMHVLLRICSVCTALLGPCCCPCST
jgi:hypothetical protein